jgi:condensin complex subunit 1
LACCRKSASLAPATRYSLIESLCQAVKILSSILASEQDVDVDDEDEEEMPGSQESANSSPHAVMNQTFRDAFACHLYMLFSVMFFIESEAKIGAGLKSGNGRGSDKSSEAEEAVAMRAACAQAMQTAAQSMSKNRHKLWRRGVPDEAVVILPCRIAYQMLESATGVVARKAASADVAMGMIAATIDSCDALLGTIVAALMDLLHSYEHMAVICAELCCMVTERPTNRLAIELIREIGRLDTRGQSEGNTGKASGIRNVAPFINELAVRRPRLVLANISHLLTHLNSEPYNLRSSIVVALGHIIEYIGKSQQPSEDQNTELSTVGEEEEEAASAGANNAKSRAALLDILEARSHDVSSYTRSAVLKVWISLTESGSLPVERVSSVTALAIDRLQDKTVVARKQAMHVRLLIC